MYDYNSQEENTLHAEGSRQYMKHFIKSLTFLITALTLTLICKTTISASEASAVDITVTSSDKVKISDMTDGSYYTSCHFNAGSDITISSDKPFYGLYITWNQNISE